MSPLRGRPRTERARRSGPRNARFARSGQAMEPRASGSSQSCVSPSSSPLTKREARGDDDGDDTSLESEPSPITSSGDPVRSGSKRPSDQTPEWTPASTWPAPDFASPEKVRSKIQQAPMNQEE